MRKLKLFFACLLMAVLSIGQMWAGQVTISPSQALNDGGVDPITIACAKGDGTSNPAISSGQLRLYQAASGKTTGNTITFSSESAITSIVFTFANSMTASNGSFSDGDYDSESSTWTGSATSLTLTVTGTTSGTRIYITNMVVTYADGGKTLSSIAVSGTPTKTAYYAGDEFDPAGLVVTGTYSDDTQATIASGITWSYDPSQTLALNQTSIGVTATVSEISSPKYNVTGLTVTEAPAAVNYEKVTAEPADWSGEYLLVYEADATNARVWKGADEANNYAEATIATGVIAAPEGAAVLTIAKVAESDPVVYTIQVGEKYIGQTSDANGIKIQDAAINNSISYNGTDAAVDIVASSAHLRYNSASSSYFRYYKSATYTSQKKIQLYKKVDGAVLPSAELSYATADQKKLAKLGDAFTAPTLTNPHSVTVTYASDNTAVAEVNASTGAVTIKASGVAVITASFDGNDDYKAGSASYTIGVTAHAGTEADPYVAADAKIAIDAMGTVENAYATGVVSNVVTKELPSEGYITFYFSADGATTGQQVEAYKCYGLNSAQFGALTDVKTGATVVVTGNLKKYNNTTYEFDQNCHLVSYEAPAVPKTHIANTKETAYTVAQALVYAADGVTYDLDDYVYVQGVVYDVKSFNEGTMNIFIKDANAENQFELYKCAGINDGSATTPFEALTDVQVGNIVIGYGQLTVYNTTFEFKQGNYLVELQAPVTGVELNATAEVAEGSTVNLTATILPSNATGTIDWSVTSGSEYASVADGVVSGIAEGEAVIRATVEGTAFYAECTVTVTAAAAPGTYDYALVTDAAQLQDGLKVIIVAAEADKAAGSAAATYRNVVDVERTTDGNYLILDSENMPTEFTLGVPSAGQYTFYDGDGYMYENAAKSVKVQADPFNWSITIGDGNIATIQATNELRYNSGSPRFTTYASGQQALQLYVKDDGKQPAGLAWSTDAVELTVGDEFTAPTLSNPNNIAAADITIASDNTDVATVAANGAVTIKAAGVAVITASYAGGDTYRAASVSYTITVNASTPTPAETKNVVILAEYNSKFYAMTNSLASGALAAVEVEKDGDKIVVFAEADKAAIQWTMTDNTTTATFQDSEDKYLAHTGTGTSLALQADAEDWTWDSENGYYYAVANRTFFYNNSGVFKNYSTSNLPAEKTDYSGAPEIIEIAAEDIILSEKAEPQLAYDPTSVTLTVGQTFVPATLTYAEGFDGLAAVTYQSNNLDLATVEGGVVSLVENATGTATITATFAGNNNYLAGSASYLITVNEAGDDLSGTWTRVTAVAAGQKIIIAGTYNEKTMAMGKQNSNNRAAVLSALEGDVLTPGAATKVLTLVDAGEGLFAIQASNGKYLNAAGTGSNNYLREADDYEAASAKWTITFDENGANIVATSTDNRNVIRYNSTNNSELFSCYAAGGQRAINIYSTTVAPEPEPVYELVRGGLEANKYYTLCFNKKMTEIRGASLWSFAGKDANMAYLVQAEAPYAAGMPYFIYAEQDGDLEAVLEGDAVTDPVAEGNNGLYGTLNYMDADALSTAGATYMLKNNELRPIGTNNHLDAQRAYVILDDIQGGAPANVPGKKVRSMPLHKDTATGIDAINASDKPMKMIIDGNIYILRGEKMYDATGRLVK